MTWGTKKKEAMKLRLNGRSYNEINKKLGIPKSTLSGWFKDVVLNKEANNRLKRRMKQGSLHLIKRNKTQTHLAWKRARKAQAEAKKEIGKLSKRDLMLIGVALYWGEGYKKLVVRGGKKRTWHNISFSNTDPGMIRIYIKFLNDILDISTENVKARMRLFEHINESRALNYWIKSTGLLKSNFQKTTYAVSISSQRRLPFNRLPYGTLCVEVANTNKFHRILGLIEGMKNSS